MSDERTLGRRHFLKNVTVGGAAIAAGIAGAPAILSSRSPNDRLRVANIGVGTRGYQLLQDVQQDPKTDVAIICDLYTGNIERARKATKYADVRVVKEWEKAVSDSSIDAVVIATPDFWHTPMVVAAAKARKDIYVEKGLCRTLAEAKAIRNAVKANKLVLQLGHHYNSEPSYHKAREIYQSGQLGKVTEIRAFIDRTNAKGIWKFYTAYNIEECPKDASPQTIDWQRFLGNQAPKRAFDAERFFTWRCWWEYGTGIAGDLMSHLWDGVNCITSVGIPESVMTHGGLYFWKDGRDVPDVWNVVFDYPKKDLAVTFACTFNSMHMDEWTYVLGHEKSMQVSPEACRTYPAEWKPEVITAIHARQRAMAQTMKMQPGDVPVQPDYSYKHGELQVSSHMQNWIDCVRNRETPRCGIDRAFEEGVTIAMSVESYRRERKVKWDPVKEQIV